MSFSSSGSIKDALNERDPLGRASLHRRLKVVMIDCGGIVPLTLYCSQLRLLHGVVSAPSSKKANGKRNGKIRDGLSASTFESCCVR
jgi:hypothetical protein